MGAIGQTGLIQLLIMVELLLGGEVFEFFLEANFVVHDCVEKDALLPLDCAAPLKLGFNHGY